MKLYVTPNSPYARITRVAALESGLQNRVDFVQVATRDTATSYFSITPLARVPTLVDGEILIADTRDICAHFDQLTDTTRWCPPETANSRTLRHIAVGFLDGIAVWLRETARISGERSEQVLRYEEHRARKALAWLETHAVQRAGLDFTTLCVGCAIDIARLRGLALDWPEIAPELMSWAGEFSERPSMVTTMPGPV